jgi:hypothetical protein
VVNQYTYHAYGVLHREIKQADALKCMMRSAPFPFHILINAQEQKVKNALVGERIGGWYSIFEARSNILD